MTVDQVYVVIVTALGLVVVYHIGWSRGFGEAARIWRGAAENLLASIRRRLP